MVLLQRKLYISKDPEGVQHFPGRGGVQLFSRVGGGGGGVQMLIPIETHITCDFPGGSGPLSPLWIRTWLPLVSNFTWLWLTAVVASVHSLGSQYKYLRILLNFVYRLTKLQSTAVSVTVNS